MFYNGDDEGIKYRYIWQADWQSAPVGHCDISRVQF